MKRKKCPYRKYEDAVYFGQRLVKIFYNKRWMGIKEYQKELEKESPGYEVLLVTPKKYFYHWQKYIAKKDTKKYYLTRPTK